MNETAPQTSSEFNVGGIALGVLLDALKKRWHMILIAVGIIVGMVGYSVARQPYYYVANARVLFQTQDNQASISRSSGPASPMGGRFRPPSWRPSSPLSRARRSSNGRCGRSNWPIRKKSPPS